MYEWVLLEKVYKGIYNEETDTWDRTWKHDMFICRNHDFGGYVFRRIEENFNYCATDHIFSQAIDTLGLDFGAVDFCSYEDPITSEKKYAVFEVNTAPGLTERSGEFYGECIKRWVENQDI